jgi:hypothetical protein
MHIWIRGNNTTHLDFIMVHTAPAQNIAAPAVRPTGKSALDNALPAALEHARRLTEMYGTDNIEVAIAWETVEELETAKARNQAKQPTTFESYCAAYPDAPECRIYED